MRRLILLAAGSALLSACSLAPHYARPAAPVPDQWPQGAAYPEAAAGEAGLPWRTLITEPRLAQVIEAMLANNRDLKAALANARNARAQMRATRAAQVPALSASGSGSHYGGTSAGTGSASDYYSADLGVSAFEIDLFGRLRNQTAAALETYLASQSGIRATRLSLVEETAQAWLTLGADEDLLTLARETVTSARASLSLEQALLASGLAAAGDVEAARSVLAGAEASLASATTQVAQDRNALDLLVGAPVPAALLPATLAGVEAHVAVPPAGLSSAVLLQRPDVVEAEHTLKSANANIGAARAAFFPKISLTAALGYASPALSSLFTPGNAGWSVAPSASLPVLGGAQGANLAAAKALRDYDAALYEKAVQTAFRDVADALARRGTLADNRAAYDRQVAAAGRSYELALAQYRVGSLAYLNVLTAQRSWYTARQNAISTLLADLSNRLALYAAVGADPTLADPAR